MKAGNALWFAQLFALACLGGETRVEELGFGAAGFGNGAGVRITTKAEPPRGSSGPGIANGYGVDTHALHRTLIDHAHAVCFGYDIFVEPLDRGSRCRVTISPLDSTRAETSLGQPNGSSATAGSGGRSLSVPANYRCIALPRYPEPRIVDAGSTLALELLTSTDGKEKITDYITVVLTNVKQAPRGPSARDSSPQDSLSFRPGELPAVTDGAQAALFRVVLRPSESLNSGWGGSDGKFTFIGSSVMNLVCAAQDIDEFRVFPACELPNGRFDAVVNVPANTPEGGRTWLRRAVETTFGLVSRRETRPMDVLVLTVTNQKAPHLAVALPTDGSSAHSDVDAGQMESINMPVSSIVASLQGALKKPVIDETGLTNRYDWQLQWDPKGTAAHSTEALLKAVREQLGLELIPAKRRVEVVVVEKAG